MAKISIIFASAILIFFGVLHLHGTFFSTDLHPADLDVTLKLKSSHIQMDETGNLWRLWLGFNAMFSVGLIFIGGMNLYLSAKHFEFLTSHYFLLLLTIASNSFFVWVGYEYMISDFVISMAIPLLIFSMAFVLIHLKNDQSLKRS